MSFDQETAMMSHEAVRMTNPMIPLYKDPEDIEKYQRLTFSTKTGARPFPRAVR